MTTPQPRPEEQAIFDLIAESLDAIVTPADDGTSHAQFDGLITYQDGHTAALEVTAPDSKETMARLARAERAGELPLLGGTVRLDSHVGILPDWVTNALVEPDVAKNIPKLQASGLDELHLALYAPDDYGFGVQLAILDAFNLTDQDPQVPQPLTDVWVPGAGRTIARWQRGHGWTRYQASEVTSEQRRTYGDLREARRAKGRSRKLPP